MYRYKIEKITFNDGLEFSPGPLSVIVGPNNSGKSRALKDIQAITTTSEFPTIVVKDVFYPLPSSFQELKEEYNITPYQDEQGKQRLRTLKSNMVGPHDVVFGNSIDEKYSEMLQYNDQRKRSTFSQWFGNFLITYLGTEDRLHIIRRSPSGDVGRQVDTLLQAFYREGKDLENILRKIIRETFKIDIKLDYSGLSNLLFRIGDSFDEIPLDPRDARPLLEGYKSFDDQGDGIKSFVATILAVMVGQRPVLLIDEPGAFLHPPQAMRLGELIAEHTREDRQTIIATHSSDILRGIINKRQDVSIIRIDRNKNQNKIYPLDADDMKKIANNPLLSSARVLEGLFYKGVVAVEADSDSTFYQRVSRAVRPSDEIHYTHAHNKQTVHKILEPYEKLGINFVAIIDFDILRVKDEFKTLLNKVRVPDDEIKTLLEIQADIVKEVESLDKSEQLKNIAASLKKLKEICLTEDSQKEPEKAILKIRSDLKKIRDNASPWSKYKAKGYSALTSGLIIKYEKLNTICRKYGLFIVPVGELESWLIPYGVQRTSNKAKWIVDALEKLPSIIPQENEDLFKFIIEVHDYLINED
ncbi:MAG: ATP-binding protein [Syntrophales bacterium]|nr:ATP-binding protein [Syntrophales bacterium]